MPPMRPPLRAVLPPLKATSRRSLVQIPHPSLDSTLPTRFVLRSPDVLPTMAHTLAVVREFEKQHGAVLSIDVPKDADTLLPGRIIKVTTLRPVQIDTTAVFEIPAPKTRSRKGGVTLDDVRGAPGNGVIQFSVEREKNREQRTPKYRRSKRRNPTEDDAVVRGLERFGGFSGEMEGVAKKFERLKVEQPVVEDVPVLPRLKLVQKEVIQPQSAVIDEAEAEAELARVQIAEEVKQIKQAVKSRAEKLAEKALEAAKVTARMEEEARAEAERIQEEVAEESVSQSSPQEEVPSPAEDKPKQEGWGWFGRK